MNAREHLVRTGGLPLLALAAFAMGTLGCDRSAPPPDIVIVLLDTVRQDRMSAFGYERPTTPELEKLQTRSATFPRAWSTSAWTVPAHASLFTGLYSAAHGATQENWTLDPDLDTLAEILAERGYQTAAVVGNGVLSAERHFGQGFENYVETFRGLDRGDDGLRIRDSETVAEVDTILAEADASRPLLLFVNLIGPHSPYDSCGDHCNRFVTDRSIRLRQNRWLGHYGGKYTLSEAELQHLSERYDAEILEVDSWLGRIVESVERHRGLEDALLVVTSDHGENFGDHGHVDHVFSLHESLTRIPLVVHYPPLFEPGSVDSRPAQLPDVFATALRVAGIDPRARGSQGRDLAAPAEPDRTVLLEYYRPKQAIQKPLEEAEPRMRELLEKWNHPVNAVVKGDWKLIVRGNGERELYDLASDPAETRNLVSEPSQAERVAQLEGELDALIAHYAEAAGDGTEHVPASEEAARDMEKLGYTE